MNRGRRAKEEPSFEALFRAYYPRLARILYRIVGQTDLAEELAAEAFWKLHQRRPAHLTNAEGWLCRAGVRLALDALRKGKRRAHYESAAPHPDSPVSPEDDFARGEEQRRVRQVLARMKTSHATLLMLRGFGNGSTCRLLPTLRDLLTGTPPNGGSCVHQHTTNCSVVGPVGLRQQYRDGDRGH